MITVKATTPTRIDLCGGTLDMWPLYLFLTNPITINCAINLYATAEVIISFEPQPLFSIICTIISEEQKQQQTFHSLEELDAIHDLHSSLKLQTLTLKNFLRYPSLKKGKYQIICTTKAQSPAGAGLGGSSSLLIALLGALEKGFQAVDAFYDYLPLSRLARIKLASDIEAQVIEIPTGQQDYFAAEFGGLQAIEWQPGKNGHRLFPHKLAHQIASHCLLFYSQNARNSGINNWAIFQDMVNKEPHTKNALQIIANATKQLNNALLQQNIEQTPESIKTDWQARLTLSDNIQTPLIKKAFDLAHSQNISSMKICGAGGGGCFFLYDARFKTTPELRSHLIHSITNLGTTHLPFETDTKGLNIEIASL